MDNVMERGLPYKLDLQMFAEDPPIDPPAPPIDPPADPPKTFTQAELDDIVAKRLDRERKKFVDYDDLKTKLTDFEKAEEERKKAAMTEQERLQAEKDAAEARAKEAEGKAQSTLDAANKRVISAEFKILARTADFNLRPDALDDAIKLADLSAVKVDEEGNVVGIKEALQALIQTKPYLVEPTKREPREIGDPNNPDPNKTDKTKEQLLAEAAEKARRTGKIADQVAYAQLKRELEG